MIHEDLGRVAGLIRAAAIAGTCLSLLGCSFRQAQPGSAPYEIERTWALVDESAAARVQALGSPVEIGGKGLVARQCEEAAVLKAVREGVQAQQFGRTGRYSFICQEAPHPDEARGDIWMLDEQPQFSDALGTDYLFMRASGTSTYFVRPGQRGPHVELTHNVNASVERTQRVQPGDGGELEGRLEFKGELIPGQALVAVGRVGKAAGIDFYVVMIWAAHR
jgi:hypothetical protein